MCGYLCVRLRVHEDVHANLIIYIYIYIWLVITKRRQTVFVI